MMPLLFNARRIELHTPATAATPDEAAIKSPRVRRREADAAAISTHDASRRDIRAACRHGAMKAGLHFSRRARSHAARACCRRAATMAVH